MPETRVHDYRQRYWGHGFTIRPDADPVTAAVTGWGDGVQQGDLLILPNGSGICIYRIESIRRPGNPDDMWFTNCRFVPPSSRLGLSVIAVLDKTPVLSIVDSLTSWRVLDA